MVSIGHEATNLMWSCYKIYKHWNARVKVMLPTHKLWQNKSC